MDTQKYLCKSELAVMYLFILAAPSALAALGVAVFARGALPAAQPARRAIGVRLDSGSEQALINIEHLAQESGRQDVTRSGLIREAVAIYLDSLQDLLAKIKDLDLARGLASQRNDSDGAVIVGKTIRVRLDEDLVEKLDQIELHARQLKRRDITRSSLIRAAVAAYVAGFEERLVIEDSSDDVALVDSAGR